MTVLVPRGGPVRTGDDFFDRFFSMSAPETRQLRTDPIALKADALPPGAPDDFTGVVGSLSIATSVDRLKARAGEALNLVVTVSGTGNLKSLAEPRRPEVPGARFFESESSVKLELAGDRLGGSKTFKTVLVPRASGTLEIPPISISYYDPAKKAYATARSAPIRVAVAPGDPNAAAPSGGPRAPGVTEVASDIRYLKAPGGGSALGAALGAFGAPGPWHALPAAFLVLALGLDWRRRARASDPLGLRAGEARAAALRALARAEAAGDGERARAVAALAEALTGYLADRLGRPEAGLTLKEALASLSARGAAASLPKVKALWDELDLLRYAPVGADRAEVKRLADEIRALTATLDKEAR
ncbi:MAG: BatD family protein [Elusimicrobiota bacterium]|nr:MAG: BatD family protein [Elusimicrobiota bacterium]